jgi:fatty acid desaturase
MHFQHHSKPNVIDKDPDTRIEPIFVLGDQIPIRVNILFFEFFVNNYVCEFRQLIVMRNMEKLYHIIFNIYISLLVEKKNETLNFILFLYFSCTTFISCLLSIYDNKACS